MAIAFFVISVIFPFLLVGIQRMSINSKLSSDFEFKNTHHTYSFTENEMYTITKSGKREAKYNVDLAKIEKIYDVGNCFYLYVTHESAFVIPKAQFVHGDVAVLEKVFKNKLNDRYIITRKGRKFLKNSSK